MKTKIYRLTFTTPLHISNVRADYGKSEYRLHSDTLYAAIMHAWALLGKPEWITQEPTFAVSSLFPFTTDNNKNIVYFFPKPFVLPIKDEDKKAELSKKFKKIQYLDKEYFEKVLKGEYNPPAESLKGEYLTDKDFEENKPKIYEKQTIPRICWNRDEKKDAEPFYMEKLFFTEGSGLWFMILCNNEEENKKFEYALNLLADEGLGTDRNVGNGKFIFAKDELNIDIPEETNYCLNLSLYCPESYEVLEEMLTKKEYEKTTIDKNIGYEIIRRGGWIGEPYNTYRKKDIYMFSEGSVFKYKCNNICVKGASHDVTPDIIRNKTNSHKIYRSGKAIFIPIKFLGNENK